ncbi:unnamed protein product [Mytilus edulis]|uniref:Uncharacterized protein n=1 Tax=Mytilus edulis TaxID=6550 RepID=A0A8S3SK22_MYTED|nr:unnamed protein product [Mytilus edulis]
MSSILSRNISSTNECTVSTLTAQPTCPNEQQTGPVSSCNKPCRPYTATNENETAVLPIQDKTIFNVQNNGQNVADNMDSSNTNTCNNNFQQKMKNSSQMNYNQLFPAGTIIQGGTFNMYFGHNPQVAQPEKENDSSYSKPMKRKRKFVIESDRLRNGQAEYTPAQLLKSTLDAAGVYFAEIEFKKLFEFFFTRFNKKLCVSADTIYVGSRTEGISGGLYYSGEESDIDAILPFFENTMLTMASPILTKE